MKNNPYNVEDLQKFIDIHNIDATILPLSEKTPTVSDAARVLAVEPDQIIKSLVFMVGGEPLLVINNGMNRVDRTKMALYFEVGKNRIKFASPDKALIHTGYQVGSMPPFGHLNRLQTIVDTRVISHEVVFGGGGEINAMMRIEKAELLKVTGAEIVDVSQVNS